MSKTIIHTDKAPAAIGAYSQAVRAGDTVYMSGQIPLDPATMTVVGNGDFRAEARQVFKNLQAVAEAARAAVGVASLPKGVQVEAEAVLVLTA